MSDDLERGPTEVSLLELPSSFKLTRTTTTVEGRYTYIVPGRLGVGSGHTFITLICTMVKSHLLVLLLINIVLVVLSQRKVECKWKAQGVPLVEV